MVKKKGKSKRQTLKQKYKIERRVKEHKRKQKKETRRRAKLGLPPLGIGQRKKAASIPNSWPFKEQLLEELAQAKRRMEEEKQRNKEEAALRRKQALLGTDVAALVKQAEARGQAFDQQRQGDGVAGAAAGGASKELRHLGQQSRRAFIRDLREVVEAADVILEVLDARDPLGSRAEAVEELILRRPGKKLVLVLNKVDLVPQEVVARWLAFLRRSHPAIAFKAATQEQRSALAQHGGDAAKAPANVLSRSGSVGAEALMQLLKNYCRSLDIKTSISVGIVGYPNVGKSSLINSLKRAKSVGVSSTPGFTKAMQEVQLDRHIKLLDSPGIVFDDEDVEGVLLRNCVSVDTLPDPVAAVQAMLKRCDPADLMMLYALPRFDSGDANAFLALLARKLGKLLKGGVPDRTAAARVLLRDWNTGKVPFYTTPPDEAEAGPGAGAGGVVAGEAQLVGSLGEEFTVLLEEGDAKVMDFLGQQQAGGAGADGFVAFRSGGVAGRSARMARMLEAAGEGMEDEGESDDGMDEEEEEGMEVEEESESGEEEEGDESEGEEQDAWAVAAPARRTSARQRGKAAAAAAAAPASTAAKGKKGKSAVEVEEAIEAAANPKTNQARAKQMKSQQKQARKASRRAAAAMDEDYDFKKDFTY